MVYQALPPLMRTPRLPVVDWTDVPRRFKWTRPFRLKTKSGFCACTITFQLASSTVPTFRDILSVPSSRAKDSSWTAWQPFYAAYIPKERKSLKFLKLLASVSPPSHLHCCSSMQTGVSKDLSAFVFRATKAASNFTVRSCVMQALRSLGKSGNIYPTT